MPRKRNYPVILTGEDRSTLEGLIARGYAPARRLTHARILLKADEATDAPSEPWPDVKIADALQISRSTVARVRERFVAEGLWRLPLSIAGRKTPSPKSSMVHRRRI
jgi:hypothetical protein